eukprot:Gb_35629 [translate_table: standard]
MYSTQSPFSSLPHPSISISNPSQSFHLPISSQSFHLPNAQPSISHPNPLSFQTPLYHSPQVHIPQLQQLSDISQACSLAQPLCDIPPLCEQDQSVVSQPVQYVVSDPLPVALSQPDQQLDSTAVSGYSTQNSSNPEVKCPENEKLGVGEGEEDGDGDDNKKKEKEHKKRSKNWTRSETLKLIRLRTELEPRFARGGRKSELWDEIAEALQQDQICRDAQQCRDKWEKLAAGYKGVRDGVRDREDNPFFEDLHPLLSGKASKKEREREKEHHEVLEAELPKALLCETARDYIVSEAENNTEKRSCEFRDEEDWEAEVVASKGRKRKRPKHFSVSDFSAVQGLIETVIEKQQEFFKELLEALERKEQIRVQARQEKEEKWRAEERAQQNMFNNAMITMAQKLVGEGGGNFTAGASVFPIVSMHGNRSLKKRSRNWKRAEVLQLIKLRGEMDSRFSESTRRGLLWDELAEHLIAQGIKRDAKQCREKWDKLMAEYKDVVDDKKEASLSPYFAELTAVLRRQDANTQ